MLQGFSMRDPHGMLQQYIDSVSFRGDSSSMLANPPTISVGSMLSSTNRLASAAMEHNSQRQQQMEQLQVLNHLVGLRPPPNNNLFLPGNVASGAAASLGRSTSADQHDLLLQILRLKQQEALGRSAVSASSSNVIPAPDMTTGLPYLVNSTQSQEAVASLLRQHQLASVASLFGQTNNNSNSVQSAASSNADEASLLLQLNATASTKAASSSPKEDKSKKADSSAKRAPKSRRRRRSPTPQRQMEQQPSSSGPLPHWSKRPIFPLGIDEDVNWLSEFHCFVRRDIVELFRAGESDVKLRNGSIEFDQVGMRCRFCAHLAPLAGRAGRASAVPSSLRQIYQSFTMMLRDHFGGCEEMPANVLQRFIELKDTPAQGATDSKRYWVSSAAKVGLVDSETGIKFSEASRHEGESAPPFGTSQQQWNDGQYATFSLVLPSDRTVASELLFVIVSQFQPIRLMESECIGNRRSLRVGLPGFGCRFCCEQRRLGLCRVFPARRRTVPAKVVDMLDHLRRCTLCPATVKEQLQRLQQEQIQKPHQLHDQGLLQNIDQGTNRDFLDRIWSRLGHYSQSA